MTATYYERFYPRDMDGVVAYVAPNDVVNKEDSAYDRFFAKVGTKECRDTAERRSQREALVRREPLEKKYAASAAENGYTFNTVGTARQGLRGRRHGLRVGLLAVQPGRRLRRHPGREAPPPTSRSSTTSTRSPASPPTPTRACPTYTPYYYQAGTELGSPTIKQPHLGSLSRYGYQPPRNFVPRDIPMKFQP